MKKLVLALLLVTIITAGAFAQEPEGLGIGIVGRWGGGWGDGIGYSGLAFALKVPSVPIYWGLNLDIGSNYFGFGVTGDHYIIYSSIVPEAGLNWFLGLGGWASFYSNSHRYYNDDYSYTGVGFGARLPVGLSWHPVSLLEIFLNIAPSLGVSFETEVRVGNNIVRRGGVSFPAGGWPLELGIRLWI